VKRSKLSGGVAPLCSHSDVFIGRLRTRASCSCRPPIDWPHWPRSLRRPPVRGAHQFGEQRSHHNRQSAAVLLLLLSLSLSLSLRRAKAEQKDATAEPRGNKTSAQTLIDASPCAAGSQLTWSHSSHLEALWACFAAGLIRPSLEQISSNEEAHLSCRGQSGPRCRPRDWPQRQRVANGTPLMG